MPGPTNMAVFDLQRNIRDSFQSSETQPEDFTGNEARTAQCGRDAGQMLCIPTHLCRGQSGLSRVELALLSYILDNPEKQGSRAEIAEDCECAPNSVPRAAKRLEARGLIKRTHGGGSAATFYTAILRNLDDTQTRNMDVARNTEVATVETSTLRAADGATETETTTTDGVVTAVTGGRNMPPPHPPNNTTSISETEGGAGGEQFALSPPATKRVRRKQHPKFVATNETLPREITPEMGEIATDAKMINGTCADQFKQWRRYHIENETVMTFANRSWQTWVNNWAKRNQPGPNGAPHGYTFIGMGDDGKPRYAKDQRTNVYR